MVKKVIILTGPRSHYGFCPVPPLTDSAPERNLYRLTEHNYGDELELTVISACSQSQELQLNSLKPCDKYRWIVFSDTEFSNNQSIIIRNKFVAAFSRRILHTPDLITWNYLRHVSREIEELRPDLLLINSLPQYIQFLKRKFPHIPLGLFMRGTLGESRRFLPKLKLIITNSAGMTEYARRILNGASVPIHQIPNTIDDRFCDSPKARFESKRIIYTGRIDPVKGVWELLQAFERVHGAFPDAELTVVGGNFGRDQLSAYESKLVAFASESGLPVKFVGQVANELLPQYYKEADLAVFPSICLESFGMVALEAMRCGLPVIASRRPGFEELIVENETGLIVDDPENIETLVNAMIDVLTSPVQMKMMGANGYQRSLGYTPRVAADKFAEILKLL